MWRAISVHAPVAGLYSSGIVTGGAPGTTVSSRPAPPTASTCPSGRRTPDENQRAWLRSPDDRVSTLPSASIEVSVVNGLAGSHEPGDGPSTPPQVTSVIWSYGGCMVSGTTNAPLRAPSGAGPDSSHFFVFGSKNL